MFRNATLLLCSVMTLAACDVEGDVQDRSLDLEEAALDDGAWSDEGSDLEAEVMAEVDAAPGRIDPNLAESGLCSMDENAVRIGDASEVFSAVSRDVVEFDPEAWLTLDPDGRTVYAKKGSHGITLECRCDSGCEVGGSDCSVLMGGSEASCSGGCKGTVSSDGSACGGCSFHYVPKDDTTEPTAPTVPTVPTVPALPTYPW